MQQMKLNIASIMPSAREERLIFLGRILADAQWEIGRETLFQVEETKAHNSRNVDPEMHIPVMDVYSYVAQLTGKHDRSIRRYYAAVQFYPPDVIEEFDILPFEYFAVAMQYPNRWREMLEAAVRGMDSNNGRLPGVRWMETYFQPVIQEDYVQELDGQPALLDIEREVEAVQDAIGDEPESSAGAEAAPLSTDSSRLFTESVLRFISGVKERVARLPVRSEMKENVLEAIAALIRALEALSGDLSDD